MWCFAARSKKLENLLDKVDGSILYEVEIKHTVSHLSHTKAHEQRSQCREHGLHSVEVDNGS